ncbi:hypothetical protein P153DRAFT_366238 [Dothidotthia symphoricarpi CBS 119687]|uniref:D-serine dehydratase n=1 Tax=Dothidotthia symphoricarpi CBS 119687 TaxID=1392245 RepID=A0A6A6ADU4_9PLEO|nr:uncharacterized protein P153DRAFT_366238 [Dothidotthia symphoricarpi CBS 119687]KAF2129736.1 hypothetical protein P153DRAFT_366238 [Dothidotthia symphoricarpi CBS 119687]
MALYPLAPHAPLLTQFLHKNTNDVPTPAIILDRALIKRHCEAMLRVCSDLGVGFRAHVKSHKTLELSKLQVSAAPSQPANFIVSTVMGGEQLADYVRECQGVGRESSILYGVPVSPSAVPRLVDLARTLAPGSVNVIVDNRDAFVAFHDKVKESGVQIGVFVKIDTGYHRAGITTSSPRLPALVETIVERVGAEFRGFYSHFGHSYAGNSEDNAAEGLIEELVGLEAACRVVPASYTGKLVLSVGATPTATAAQNMLSSGSPRVKEFQEVLGRLKEKHVVELHAGVYPLLDCQQVATHARPAAGIGGLSKENIAIRMLMEVTSVYDERAKPEALVSAGSLAMGREPCKSYPGWGIVTGAMGNSGTGSVYDESGDKTGWIVGRISQEHGILTWEGEREKMNPLAIGDRVTIWPNHACVAGAGFGWYLVVDSDEGKGDVVVDVWVRWRGW